MSDQFILFLLKEVTNLSSCHQIRWSK